MKVHYSLFRTSLRGIGHGTGHRTPRSLIRARPSSTAPAEHASSCRPEPERLDHVLATVLEDDRRAGTNQAYPVVPT